MGRHTAWGLFSLVLTSGAFATDLEVEGIQFKNIPEWFQKEAVEKSLKDLRLRSGWVPTGTVVHFYSDLGLWNLELLRVGFQSTPTAAFADPGENAVRIGPSLKSENFEHLFLHEVSHLVSWQIFRGLPSWLEEGFAEWLARSPYLDYSWINQQLLRIDPRNIANPMKLGGRASDVRFRYQISYASVMMLDKRCPDLIAVLKEISQDEKNFDKIVKDRCGIHFFFSDFWQSINDGAMDGNLPKFKN